MKLRCGKIARRCGEKHICKSKCTKHSILGPLFEVAMTSVELNDSGAPLPVCTPCADGATQQPFYQVVRHGCDTGTQLLAALSILIMLPVCVAPREGGERLMAEASLCHEV